MSAAFKPYAGARPPLQLQFTVSQSRLASAQTLE
jgi:hypothetical protein